MSETNTSQTRPARRGRGPMQSGMPGEKAKDFKGTLKKLLKYASVYRAALIIVIAFAMGSTVFSIAGPKVLSQATTEIFTGLMSKIGGTGGIDFTKIGYILLSVLGLYLISSAFSFVQGWLMSGITQKLSFRMRKEISEKISRMPMSYFESKTVGEVLSRITNDVDTLGQSLNQSVTQLITSVTTVIGIIIIMLTISPLITLIAVLVIPLSAIFMGIVIKISQKYFKAQQKYLGKINGQVEEIYSGHRVVKAFGREESVIEEFDKTNDILFESAWKSQFLSGLMQPVMNLVGNLG